MGIIKVTRISKPLVITSIILIFLGSILGAISMLILFGFRVSLPFDVIGFHRTIQLDGAIIMLIMGIGYMLIPRFRNIQDPLPYQVYIPYILLLLSLILSIVNTYLSNILRLFGIILFSLYILNTLKVRPRLLPHSDYYIALGVISLLIINIIKLFHTNLSLNYIQFILIFPLLMILGVEYKTLPSFIGYINPKMNYTKISIILASLSILIGSLSIFINLLGIFFAILLLITIIMFDKAVYATHGFDYSNIINRLNGEELKRYKFTLIHIRLSYIFLYLALVTSILYYINNSFALYDLSIHLLAIGFIGITIKIYLPMMLPPIIGKSIRFVRLNLIPLYIILLALALRAIGVFMLQLRNEISMIFGFSGWLIIIALIIYIKNIQKSMS